MLNFYAGHRKKISAVVALTLLSIANAPILAEEKQGTHSSSLQDFIHGTPPLPSTAWTLAAGGRIYDTWWDALDRKKPTETHPAYPKEGKRSGANTWRCVECHGWDYKGKDGVSGKDQSMGDRYTGIIGVRNARRLLPAAFLELMRSQLHGYTPEMISDAEILRLAAFVRSGQHDADQYIDRATGKVRGNVQRGATVYQTICAACHGLDGRALNWGTQQEPGYIGTEAKKLPWEVLHKMRNAHPGAAMVNLRSLSLTDAINTLAYTQTLPEK
jgi:thiosulfate dehydrogenase